MKSLLFALVILAGCAPTTKDVWVKQGATQQDFFTDADQCKAQAFSAPGMPMAQAPGMPMMQVENIYNSCMQGKGWHTETVPVEQR